MADLSLKWLYPDEMSINPHDNTAGIRISDNHIWVNNTVMYHLHQEHNKPFDMASVTYIQQFQDTFPSITFSTSFVEATTITTPITSRTSYSHYYCLWCIPFANPS